MAKPPSPTPLPTTPALVRRGAAAMVTAALIGCGGAAGLPPQAHPGDPLPPQAHPGDPIPPQAPPVPDQEQIPPQPAPVEAAPQPAPPQ